MSVVCVGALRRLGLESAYHTTYKLGLTDVSVDIALVLNQPNKVSSKRSIRLKFG